MLMLVSLMFCEVMVMGVRLCADERSAVNYVLRGGELFNMVLLVPDDMPAGATTLAGNVDEMRALYKDWDPRYFPPFHSPSPSWLCNPGAVTNQESQNTKITKHVRISFKMETPNPPRNG